MQQKRFQLRLLRPDEQQAAVRICARSMRDNPLHIRTFGSSTPLREHRLQVFFPRLLAYVADKGQLYGAFANEQLIGVLGLLPPGHCRPTLIQSLRLLPLLLRAGSPAATLRCAWWLASWRKLDSRSPHWHLGPLAVAPNWQGRGAGRQLMEKALTLAGDALCYLETDKPENAAFYSSLGFVVQRQQPLLGCTCWYMIRTPLHEKKATLLLDKRGCAARHVVPG